MYTLNGTYVIFIPLFLAFIYLLNEIMLKPVGRAMEKRRAKMQEDLDRAKACTQKAQKMLDDYQSALHTSRLEAQSVIQTALAAAQRVKEAQLKTVQKDGEGKVDALKKELAGEKQNLLKSLVHPELELVGQIIKKLLGEGTPALVTSEDKVLKTLEETPIK